MPLTSNNMGNMGIAPGGEPGAYPAGSLPFGDILTAGNQTPANVVVEPVDDVVPSFPLRRNCVFPIDVWHPSFLSLAVVAEFAATQWPTLAQAADPTPRLALGVTSFDALVDDEIKTLIRLAAARRPGRMAEIIAQADDARPYWSNMLLSGPTTRPYTWTLVETGRAVGQMVVMHYKMIYNRPRPAQLYPALMPPIITPPHPSYPNAHALQSLLMSCCVAEAVPSLAAPLEALAARVGENREIAGVHYPSDRKASEYIAPFVMHALRQCPLFRRVVAQASHE